MARTATATRTAQAATVSALLACALASPALAQTERFSLGGDRVAIFNLAGRVTVEPGTGSGVVVEVTRGGDDGGRLRVESDERDDWRVLRVIYPERDIVYDGLSSGFRTQFSVREDGTFGNWNGQDEDDWGFSDILRAIFGSGDGSRVTIRGSGSGLEAHADLRVLVPAGRTVAIYHGAGEIDARNIDGRIRLDSHVGPINARDMRGAITLDTGSGRVHLDGAEGNVLIDTGSGNVTVSRVRGERLNVDTGSGSVTGSELDADRIVIDTGSGRVNLDGVTTERLEVDTGSGSVELLRTAAPSLLVDTGSGSVEADLTVAVRDAVIDTGSGGVTLRVPEDLDARIVLDSGSGGVRTDFAVQVTQQRRSYLNGVIGAGNGRIVVDTGSGGIRLMKR